MSDRMADIRQRVTRIVSEVSRIPEDQVASVDRFTDLEQWDSLLHLNVVLALEGEFGVQFDIDEVTLINSVGEAVALVQRKAPGT